MSPAVVQRSRRRAAAEKYTRYASAVFFLILPWLVGCVAIGWTLTNLGSWAWCMFLALAIGIPSSIYNHYTMTFTGPTDIPRIGTKEIF